MTLSWRVFSVLLVPFLMGVTMVADLSADSSVLERVLKSSTLKVGMSGNQPPMNARDREGQMMGLEVDLAKMLAMAMDVELEIVTKPFPELFSALEGGEVDIVMSGITITSKRATKVSFVGPYMLSGKSILTKSDLLASADDAEELNEEHLIVAVLKNSTSQAFVEKYLPKVKVLATDDYDSAVGMVIDGRATLMVADMPVCVVSVLKNPEADLETLTRPLTVEPFGIAVPAADTQLLNLIQNYFETIKEMGALENLKRKWLDDGVWLDSLP